MLSTFICLFSTQALHFYCVAGIFPKSQKLGKAGVNLSETTEMENNQGTSRTLHQSALCPFLRVLPCWVISVIMVSRMWKEFVCLFPFGGQECWGLASPGGTLKVNRALLGVVTGSYAVPCVVQRWEGGEERSESQEQLMHGWKGKKGQTFVQIIKWKPGNWVSFNIVVTLGTIFLSLLPAMVQWGPLERVDPLNAWELGKNTVSVVHS